MSNELCSTSKKTPQNDSITPEFRELEAGETVISYLFYPGGPQHLVCLHATGFLPWLWDPVVRRMAPEWTIIAPYFCGHREASLSEGGLNWRLLAQDLKNLMNALEIENPFMVGHSMGATVISLMEALYGPWARKLMLIEPIFLPEFLYAQSLRVEDHPLASKSIKRRNEWANEKEAADYLRSKPLFRDWTEEMLAIYIRHGMMPREAGGLQLTCHPRYEAALFMGGAQFNPWPLLTDIRCQAMVVEGENSSNRKHIDLKKITRMLPKGEYTLVPKAGHLIPMEQPEAVYRLIQELISD